MKKHTNGKLQDVFLEYFLECNVTIFLVSGIKLSGLITYVDADAMTLERDGVTQLIYKHAVATVLPQDAFTIYEIMGE